MHALHEQQSPALLAELPARFAEALPEKLIAFCPPGRDIFALDDWSFLFARLFSIGSKKIRFGSDWLCERKPDQVEFILCRARADRCPCLRPAALLL